MIMEVDMLVQEIRQYVQDNLPLSELTDEELEEKIETIVYNRTKESYLTLNKKISIVQQVYSSIRGLGLLDSIMQDDSITEVMINGPDHIFIEKEGRLQRLPEKFESQRKLEDIIQRIVGQAGREVNQANPIVDTRLPDGSPFKGSCRRSRLRGEGHRFDVHLRYCTPNPSASPLRHG